MKRKLLYILLTLSLIGLLFTGCKKEDKAAQTEPTTDTVVIEEQLLNEPRWVTADPSLRIRDSVGSEGNIIGNIPLGEEVTLLEESGDELTIAGATGRWSRVKWQQLEGWVFGGFLTTERPVVEVETEENADKVTDMWVTGVGIKLFDTNMTPIKVIPHATKLKVKNTIKDDLSTVYMGLPGQWLEVEWNGTEGLYFSAFLSEQKVFHIEVDEKFIIGKWEVLQFIRDGEIISLEDNNLYVEEYKNDSSYLYSQTEKEWGLMHSISSKWKLSKSTIYYTNVKQTILDESRENMTREIISISNNIMQLYGIDRDDNIEFIITLINKKP